MSSTRPVDPLSTMSSSLNPPLLCPPPRHPLRDITLSTSGNLTGRRVSTPRPTPSVDKENLFAVRMALDQRQGVINRQAAAASRVLDELMAIRDRLEASASASAFSMAADTAAATRPAAHPRLSMPLDSDDSGSEPDLSMLGMTRAGGSGVERPADGLDYGETDDWYEQPYEPGDTSIEEQTEEQEEASPLFDPATVGLKEISNLGKFTVSSHKQGNGVEELRSDDLKLYWQSDGPQPHRLTVYFVKRVGIRDIRFFVDYAEDESYTPTKIVFKSGTSENNLIEFASMNLESPVGWQQVPIAGAGGDPDGNTLVSYVLQMQILDNHQNGKDTHLRGIKIYAFDADSAQGAGGEAAELGGPVHQEREDSDGGELGDSRDKLSEMARTLAAATLEPGDSIFTIPDFMREPEIR